MRSLAERIRAFEQQKARMANVEARLRLAEKKARTRRLIESGAFVEKAGLLSLTQEALYGALLSLRSGTESAKQMAQWQTDGAQAIAADKAAVDDGSAALMITIPAALHREAAADLRALGLRFNKFLRHWEGIAPVEEAEKLTASLGGTLTRIEDAVPRPMAASDVAAPFEDDDARSSTS